MDIETRPCPRCGKKMISVGGEIYQWWCKCGSKVREKYFNLLERWENTNKTEDQGGD